MTACLMIAAAVAGQADGAIDSIRIRNDCNQPWQLWMYVDARKAWSRPELFLPRKSSVKVNLAAPGRYYLVLRDEAKRDSHYGWVDLHRVARERPNDVVALTTVLETKTREETYTVNEPQTITRSVPVLINGKIEYREEVRTVNYPVKRTRTVEYTAVVPRFDVHSNGQTTALWEFDSQAPNTSLPSSRRGAPGSIGN